MEHNIEVSIIIPVYNVENYIGKTIESVQAQDFDQYEIVLVDDGSKDRSGEICDKYAKEDVRLTVIHQQNGGVMAARMAGVNMSKGRYIVFLDGDDIMTPGAISTFYKVMLENDVDIIYGNWEYIDERGIFLFGKKKKEFENVLCNNKVYRRYITRHPIGMSSKMYKKEIILNPSLVYIDPQIKNNEDIIFNIFISSRVNSVMSIDYVIAQYVSHQGSASRVEYPTSYWLFMFQWLDRNFQKYDVYEMDYLSFKLKTIFYKLIREKDDVDFTNECFQNLSRQSYNLGLGIIRNIALFAIKHPYQWLLPILRFHPRRVMQKL